MPNEQKLKRRGFLKVSAAASAGLVIGFYLPADQGAVWARKNEADEGFAPNAFLAVGTDESITIWVHKSEMGQGVRTALPMLVAEELEADWSKIQVRQADYNAKYGSQETGGSSSLRSSWEVLRKAGAAARQMLIVAAAQQWAVDAATCRAENGVVIHRPTGRRLSYGKLAHGAARMPVPTELPLKDPKDFRIIGQRIPRVDGRRIVSGKAIYGFDVQVPGMLYATVERSPVFGGRVASFNATRATALEGVRRVVQISSGVAVIAESTWAALKGRELLEVAWDQRAHAELNSVAIRRRFMTLAEQPGVVAVNEGDAANALAGCAKRLEAVYETPFLAHAPMEPMNCVADVSRDRCEVWAPTQKPKEVHETALRLTGLSPGAVTVHITLLGGAFGRRLENDYAAEAIEVSKAIGAPVQVVWTRSDDMKHGFYRPASLHRMSAGIDKSNQLTAWTHRVVAPSVIMQRWEQLRPTLGDWIRKDGLDETTVLGAVEMPYEIANVHVDYCMANTPVPTTWWRGTYDSLNAFANECFLDEVATAIGKDPYELRRSLLGTSPKVKAVLELAATKAGWRTPPPRGRFRGIAAHVYFRIPVAHVVELSVSEDGGIKIHRVVSAVDCGMVVNPSMVEAQVEGSIADGLFSTLKAGITIEGGRVQQSSYQDHPVLRMGEMPKIEVHIMPSTDAPRGIGEPGVPPVAPAVANAIYAATGKRIRRLPVRAEDLRGGAR